MPPDRALYRVITVACLVFCGTLSVPAYGQSANDLAAFSALVLSPVGGLPPLARDEHGGLPASFDVTIRYGGWRYDIDDGVHNNAGLTFTKRLGKSRSTVALTGSYVSLTCACSVWMSGGIELRSVLWSATRNGANARGVSGHIGGDVSLGAARYMSGDNASALSTAMRVDLGAGIPFLRGTRIMLSVLPGYGWGRLSSVDAASSGLRPLVGMAAAWMIRRGFAVDVGTQRVFLPGGPTQLGAGLSWVRQ